MKSSLQSFKERVMINSCIIFTPTKNLMAKFSMSGKVLASDNLFPVTEAYIGNVSSKNTASFLSFWNPTLPKKRLSQKKSNGLPIIKNLANAESTLLTVAMAYASHIGGGMRLLANHLKVENFRLARNRGLINTWSLKNNYMIIMSGGNYQVSKLLN